MAKERKDGGGKIIHISSVAANVAWNGMAHYSASKGGLDALMRAMAFELAPKNICVNVISPGVIDCPEQNIVIKNEAIDKMITTNPDKRFGKPEDVAGAALYLASERANHVTGITLVVDGGYTVR
jgi:glucose 1-dehydrogenase